jgi:hypothetical protein
LEKTMTMLLDDGIGPALRSISPRLRGIAACTLGLMLALCLAGLAGLLAFDTAAAVLGFVAGGGLITSHAVVCDALARAGPHGRHCEPIVGHGSGRSSRNGSSGSGGGPHEATKINA